MSDDTTRQLLAAGWVELQGNELVLTEKGRAALRHGLPSPVPRVGQQVAVDSKLARSRPHIKKKNKRH